MEKWTYYLTAVALIIMGITVIYLDTEHHKLEKRVIAVEQWIKLSGE